MNNRYNYKKLKYSEEFNEDEYITYDITGINIDDEDDSAINHVNFEIIGFNNAPSEITKNPNDKNSYILKIKKLENVYIYKGKIKVTTNFGESIIDNIYFEIQKQNAPYLESNEIYDRNNNEYLYKVTKNTQNYITYQMTGDNIKVNSEIEYVNWTLEGFNNCASIDNKGLITVTKNKDLYTIYEGNVTVETNFGSYTQFIKFDDTEVNLNIRLNWSKNVNDPVTDLYEILSEINYNTKNKVINKNIQFYYDVETENGYVSCSTASELNNIIPSYLTSNINEVRVKIIAEWNNCYEKYTNSNSGNIEIKNTGNISNNICNVRFLPSIANYWYNPNSGCSSYINIRRSTNGISLNYKDYSQIIINELYIHSYYVKGDFYRFDKLMVTKNSLPTLNIYAMIYKNNIFYCQTEPITLHIGYVCKYPPKLTKINYDKSRENYNSATVTNNTNEKIITFNKNDIYPLSCELIGEHINEELEPNLGNIKWKFSGFDYANKWVEYKDNLCIFYINPKDDRATTYTGYIYATNDDGTASMKVTLKKNRIYLPEVISPPEGLLTSKYYTRNSTNKITFTCSLKNFIRTSGYKKININNVTSTEFSGINLTISKNNNKYGGEYNTYQDDYNKVKITMTNNSTNLSSDGTLIFTNDYGNTELNLTIPWINVDTIDLYARGYPYWTYNYTTPGIKISNIGINDGITSSYSLYIYCSPENGKSETSRHTINSLSTYFGNSTVNITAHFTIKDGNTIIDNFDLPTSYSHNVKYPKTTSYCRFELGMCYTSSTNYPYILIKRYHTNTKYYDYLPTSPWTFYVYLTIKIKNLIYETNTINGNFGFYRS